MIFKDLEMLQEAYNKIQECSCGCTNCESGGTCECEEGEEKIKESKKEKPDYLDADEDGDKKESMKKALKDKEMKESLHSFKSLYNAIMLGESPSAYSTAYEHDKKVWMLRRLSNGEISNINDEEQYIVTWKNPEKHNNQEEQPLKGESVHTWLNDIKSLRRAFSDQP